MGVGIRRDKEEQNWCIDKRGRKQKKWRVEGGGMIHQNQDFNFYGRSCFVSLSKRVLQITEGSLQTCPISSAVGQFFFFSLLRFFYLWGQMANCVLLLLLFLFLCCPLLLQMDKRFYRIADKNWSRLRAIWAFSFCIHPLKLHNFSLSLI